MRIRISSVKPFIFFITSAAFLSSCSMRPEPATNPSEGMPGEVLVVAAEDKVDAIKEAFQQNFKVVDSTLFISEKASTPSWEPGHGFWYAREESFEGVEKTSPLILLFGEAGKYTSWLKKMHPVNEFATKNGYSIQVYENVWAKPQTVFRLRFGRDITPSQILAGNNGEFLDSVISIYEKKQGLPGNLSPNKYTDSVSKLIMNNYGFTLHFSPQFRLVASNQEMVWLHQETLKFYRDIFINIFSDTTPMKSIHDAVVNRNKFTKKYLRNAEGTDIKVSESNFYAPRFKNNETVAHMPAMVLRGWYQEEGTFRRGPFVRYIFHDTEQHRYIALDGFVHAPEMDRLQLYRIFDHIANSFQLSR